jgi:hypothetical protein
MPNLSDPAASLLALIEQTSSEIPPLFSGLNAEQLNWRPAPERWSIAQCFDHLLTAHGSYIPIFHEILAGRKRRTFLESLPLLPWLYGRSLVLSLEGEMAKMLQAPKVFRPSQSQIDPLILERFLSHQQNLSDHVRSLEKFDPEEIILTSPANPLVVYSLADTYGILKAHLRLHFEQAKTIRSLQGLDR